MRKLLPLLLAAALTCATVYLYLKSAATSNRAAAADTSAPHATIERARHTATEIEQSTQVRIDNLAKKTE